MATTTEADIKAPSFVNRITSYPAVLGILNRVSDLYSRAKKVSPILSTGLQTAERVADIGLSVIQPVIDNIENTSAAKAINSLACRQLDTIENVVGKSKASIDTKIETACQYYEAGKQTVSHILSPATKIIAKGREKLDDTITILGKPLHLVLDRAETLVDDFLPEETLLKEDATSEGLSTNPEDEEETAVQKPSAPRRVLSLTFTTAHRLKDLAFSKLKNLQLRTADRIAELRHSISLIDYAATHLETAQQSLKPSVTITQNYIQEIIGTLQKRVTGVYALAQTAKNAKLAELYGKYQAKLAELKSFRDETLDISNQRASDLFASTREILLQTRTALLQAVEDLSDSGRKDYYVAFPLGVPAKSVLTVENLVAIPARLTLFVLQTASTLVKGSFDLMSAFANILISKQYAARPVPSAPVLDESTAVAEDTHATTEPAAT